MAFIMEIVETSKQPVVAVRTTTAVENLPNIVGPIYDEIVGYIMANKQEPLGPAFIAYYNMDMENLDIKIGFPVATALPGNDRIEAGFIPAGKKATTFHKGSYGDIGVAYQALSEYLVKAGYEATGVAYEYYYNSPGEVPESELLTRIELLLR